MSDIALKILIVSLPYGLFLLFCASYISSSVKLKLSDKTFKHKDRVGTAYRVSFYKLAFFLICIRSLLLYGLDPSGVMGVIMRDAVFLFYNFKPYPIFFIWMVTALNSTIFAFLATSLSYLLGLSKQHRVLE